jgi:hypothetical protein
MPTFTWINSTLPTTAVENSIFAFWDDVYQRNGICTATVGTAPLRRYIAEWEDNFFYPPGSSNASEHVTFEISLSEGSNAIDVLYNQMEGQGDRATGNSATVGIQRDTGLVLRPRGLQQRGHRLGGQLDPLAAGHVERLQRHGGLRPLRQRRALLAAGRVRHRRAGLLLRVAGVHQRRDAALRGGDLQRRRRRLRRPDRRRRRAGLLHGPVGHERRGRLPRGHPDLQRGRLERVRGPGGPGRRDLQQPRRRLRRRGRRRRHAGLLHGPHAGTGGVGVCRAGTQACSAGAWGACTGQTLPAAEICNNLDDNCNGIIDDGVTQGCYTGPTGTGGVGSAARARRSAPWAPGACARAR